MQLLHGDCLELMQDIPDNAIDLTVTSPPYDNLRAYNGFTWDFEGIAKELYRATKQGGVVVWVVNDSTVNGSETGTSFRQALYFMSIGFNLHDTMIYQKRGSAPLKSNRYNPSFEYMFVFSKNKPKTFNPLVDDCVQAGKKFSGSQRNQDGSTRAKNGNGKATNNKKTRDNVWPFEVGFNKTTKDTAAYGHPAMFPEKLAQNHILSWSNKGDVIFDPFMGSGTTGKMAIRNGREFIGMEISQEYFQIAKDRIDQEAKQVTLFEQ